jgi:hypothetical protein
VGAGTPSVSNCHSERGPADEESGFIVVRVTYEPTPPPVSVIPETSGIQFWLIVNSYSPNLPYGGDRVTSEIGERIASRWPIALSWTVLARHAHLAHLEAEPLLHVGPRIRIRQVERVAISTAYYALRSDIRNSGNVLFEGRSRLRHEDVRALSETNLQPLTVRTTIPFIAPTHSSL